MTDSTAGRAASRSGTSRLVAALAVFAFVPLTALTWSSITFADRAVRKEVRARLTTTAAVTSFFLREQVRSLAELVDAFAVRPNLVAALGTGDPATFDRTTIDRHLDQLLHARGGVAGTFLTTVDGTLADVQPPTPTIVGRSFAFRDWYRGLTRSGATYVSEAYQSAIAGEPLVVSAATFVKAPDGRRLGIIAAAYSLGAIQDFATKTGEAQGVQLSITDQRGTLLARAGRVPRAIEPQRVDPIVADALRGHHAVVHRRIDGRGMLVAYQQVSDIGWTASAMVPERAALRGVRDLRSTVLSVAGVLGLVLAGGLVMLAGTERRRAGAELEALRAAERVRRILETTAEAFIAIDRDGRITAWNAAAEATFGWASGEVMGLSVASTIIPEQHRDAHAEGLRRAVETGDGPIFGRRIEITALRRDGHEIPVELVVTPIAGDAQFAFVGFLHDISDRRRTQHELEAARDEALEASRLKSEFLANMSHEVRTPMNGVLGMLSLLAGTNLDAEQQEFVETAGASAEHLLAVLNDILDFSKIEAGHLDIEREPFDLRGLVEQVTDLFAPRADEHDIEMMCSIATAVPAVVTGDGMRVRQVLSNLLSNAVKFTETGEIVVSVTKGAGNAIRIAVRDTGTGIPAGELDRLFESFTQLDASTTRRYGGTGLGLAISRRLVELMGGRIEVTSVPGDGSTFAFTLPLPASAEAPALPRADLTGLRVLIVDDNATNRAVLDQMAAGWGMPAVLVHSGEAALAELRRAAGQGNPFDVVLLDFNMPDMDGIAVARAMQGEPRLAAVRRILLTSSAHRAETAAAAAAGIAGTLNKPVRASQLFDLLAEVTSGAPMRARSPVAAVETTREPAHAKAVVLVAEDNVISQKVAVRMLERLGYAARVSANGREALDALERTGADLVLMDCQMPEMDGFEATAAIRALERGGRQHTPIVAMTAAAMEGDRERCLAAGMDDYLAKPLREADLADVLERWAAPSPSTRAHDGNATGGPADGGPVLDEAALEQIRVLDDGGTGLLADLVALLLRDSPPRIAEMRAAHAAGDARALSDVAHAMKGAASNLGARRLAEQCRLIEEAGRAGRRAPVEVLDGLEDEFARAAAALTTILGPTPEPRAD